MSSNESPYRKPGPLACLAPRTPWHRLAWAWCRGVFGRMRAAQWRRSVDEYGFTVRTRTPVEEWEGLHPFAQAVTPRPPDVPTTPPGRMVSE